MHELLFRRRKALEDGDLRGYAAHLGMDVAAYERDRASPAVLERIQRDIDSGLASGQVLGTPTLFIDGVVHRRGYDPPTLLAALAVLLSSEAAVCRQIRAVIALPGTYVFERPRSATTRVMALICFSH